MHALARLPADPLPPPRIYDGLPVIDADADKMENPVVFFDYLDARFRDRLGSRLDRWGQQRLVVQDRDPRTGATLERVFPQPEGPGKGAFAAVHPEPAIGGVFNSIRIASTGRSASVTSTPTSPWRWASSRASSLRERGGRDGKLYLLGKAKGIYDLLVHAERERRTPDRDAYLFEHRALDHDPTDYVRRGQVFVSFESDDPAPAYLRAALGPLGEDVACFSADYGHWDGVLADCVKNVARTGEYDRTHLAKLLAGNCLRFYGRRLADALGV